VCQLIVVTRISGTKFALNPDLIERCDANPDSIVTLVNGARYMVLESLDEIVDLVTEFRAEVLQRSYRTEVDAGQRTAANSERLPRPAKGSLAEAVTGAVNTTVVRNLIELPIRR